MHLITQLDPLDSVRVNPQPTCSVPGRAWLSLTPDEAAFVDAAAMLVVDEESMAGCARYIDQKLWGIDLLAETNNTYNRNASRLALYKESIAAVQAHARRAHGRRFQQLDKGDRLAILAQLEAGELFAGSSRFQMFITALLNDAVEAYFDARQRRSRPASSAAVPCAKQEVQP